MHCSHATPHNAFSRFPDLLPSSNLQRVLVCPAHVPMPFFVLLCFVELLHPYRTPPLLPSPDSPLLPLTPHCVCGSVLFSLSYSHCVLLFTPPWTARPILSIHLSDQRTLFMFSIYASSIDTVTTAVGRSLVVRNTVCNTICVRVVRSPTLRILSRWLGVSHRSVCIQFNSQAFLQTILWMMLRVCRNSVFVDAEVGFVLSLERRGWRPIQKIRDQPQMSLK